MKILHSLMAAGLLLSSANLLADSREGAEHANAKALIGHTQFAVGQVVRAAQSDPQLDADRSEGRPFCEVMKGLNAS